jgi:hypothetical protein
VLDPLPVVVLKRVALLLAASHMLARPHVLVLPVMVAWAGTLVRSAECRSPPPFAALPLLILWANLHGSVALGVGLIGPMAIEALWNARRSARRGIAAQWLLFAALAVVAASMTPYGPGTLLIPLTTFSLGDALTTINEWRPQDFSKLGSFETVLLFALFALSRGVTLPVLRVLVVLGLFHLALAQTRHVDVLAMLAPIFLAHPIARQFNLRNERPAAVRTTSVPSLIAGLIAAAALPMGISLMRDVAPNWRITPQAAVTAADLANAGPLLNDYGFGGYLIYAGIAPFIDGRGEIYGEEFIMRHHRAVMLQDLPDLLKLLDEYHIGATLLAPSTPAVALLDRLPGWRRAYADEIAVVHKRSTGANPG